MPMIAAQTPKKMLVTKRLVKQLNTSMGELRLADSVMGTVGVLFVFESKDAAERMHGIGVETVEIEFVC